MTLLSSSRYLGLRAVSLTRIQEKIDLPVDGEALAALNGREFRAIYVSLGWDTARIFRNLRAGTVWTFFTVSMVWLGTVMWGGVGGNWMAAPPIGSLLLASLALLWDHT